MELISHTAKINSRQINLRPFGDLQKGEAGFREDLWKKWKRDALEDKTALIIGMGDYFDKYRPTIQHKIQHAFIEDDSAALQFENLIMRETQLFADELKPFRNRIIGLHDGHHFVKLGQSGGITSVQYLCQLLRVPYLGFMSVIKLRLTFDSKHGRIIDIFSTHGCGGSSKVHSDIAKLETAIAPYWDVDLFLRGHSTRVWVIDGPMLSYVPDLTGHVKEMVVKRKKRVLVNCGGFMEGYTQGKSSYVEQRNLPPIPLGWPVVNIHLTGNGDESIRITGHAETE
jgi:hypothetical protein